MVEKMIFMQKIYQKYEVVEREFRFSMKYSKDNPFEVANMEKYNVLHERAVKFCEFEYFD